MELLEQTICKEGKILDGDILKADGFFNRRICCASLEKSSIGYTRIAV